MEEYIFSRTCNGCTACCKTHAVEEVGSIAGIWCPQCQIGVKCLIYEDRPLGCRRYSCVWLQGKGKESDRPDRLKIVMDYLDVQFRDEEIPIFNFWEVEKGSIDQPRVQQIMITNIKAGNIVVHRSLYEPPTYYFPKGMFSPDEQLHFIESANLEHKYFF
jgi:hypothetical protein